MSHSTCLVIVREAEGPEEAEALAEELLAPWSEQLEVTPYRLYKEGEAADHWYAGHLKSEGKPLPEPVTWVALAKAYNDAYGEDEGLIRIDDQGLIRIDDQGLAYSMSIYNQKAKWDWYLLGGRWTGFFPVKADTEGLYKIGAPGTMAPSSLPGTADLARKDAIDFDYMRRQKVIDAEARYAEFQSLIDSLPEDERTFTSWGVIMAAMADIEAARTAYHGQPIMKAMREQFRSFGMSDPDDYFYRRGGREAYVADAEASAFSTFAVLDGGDWHERGSMGWFGVVSDEKDNGEWNAQFTKLLESLDDTTYLAVYDLHI